MHCAYRTQRECQGFAKTVIEGLCRSGADVDVIVLPTGVSGLLGCDKGHHRLFGLLGECMTSLSGGLSQEQYAAIGKVANEWSFVDALLRHSIALVSKIDQELSAKMTASLMSNQLYDLYLAILHDGNDGPQCALYQHISAARKRFDELKDKRNKIVHLDWTLDWLDDAVAVRNRARGKWTSTVERFSTAEMETLAVEIKGLGDALWQYVLDWSADRLAPLPLRK